MRKLIQLVGKFIPLVGNIIDNVKSKDRGEGNLEGGKLILSIIRLIITCLIVYLILKGEASVDDLEVIKTI